MKPLTQTKVRRGETLSEWISGDAQDTVAGCSDFWKRQQERMQRAQADRVEQVEKVRTLKAAK